MKAYFASIYCIIICCATHPAFSQCPANEHFYAPLDEARQFDKNPTCYHPEGYVFSWSSRNGVGLVPLYRFYDPITQFHFYTQSKDGEGLAKSWHYDGICGYVAQTPLTGTIPIYRFSHGLQWFYTNDPNGEASNWHSDGIAFYAWTPNKQDVNIIRLYSPDGSPTNLSSHDIAIWRSLGAAPPQPPVNNCIGNACNAIKWYKNTTSQGGLIFENTSGRTITLTLRSQNAIGSNPLCSDPSNYDISAHDKFGYGIGNMTFCSPFEANYK